MGLFRRRGNDGPDWITDLPGASRATRRFYQELIREYLVRVRSFEAAGHTPGPAGTWDLVGDIASLHNSAVRVAEHRTGRVDVMHPEVQEALRIALDQYAAHYNVRGGLVRAWGVAKAFNERFASRWQRSEQYRIGWWEERPIAFACILHPTEEGEPVIDGILLFDHVGYEFTPDADTQPQVCWNRSQVREAEKPERGATALRLDPTTGYSRADIAGSARVILETPAGPLFTDPSKPLPRLRQRRNWGSVG
ncbi:hypothetical protein [Streptomyces sp. CA-106110]|uniref:hypothetical protein n=1 Tax=Streptomyces sp. CA-106110 TaxID=3240044 RepID=UPI003D8CC9B9